MDEELEKKYIELLLKRCVNFDNSKSLFISYEYETDFVYKLVKEAKQMGIDDIFLYKDGLVAKHEVLSLISLEEIDEHPLFDKQIWDEYALKKASFIILTTEIPGLMDDIDSDKLARARYIDRITRPIYKKMQLNFEIPWCIAAIPNKLWAKKLFPDIFYYDEAYNKLSEYIFKMCMVNTENPIESWDKFLIKQNNMLNSLNNLQISKMHYENNLGTDITVELDKDALWASGGSLGENMLVNMPTYEVFTTPVFYKTNGIVYGSKPLIYNGGLIDNFYLEFKDGKVINYDAKTGLGLLKGIIESDLYSSFLGEVAIVNHDSPISNTGLVFGNTLFDENASCHMALGKGFSECIKNSDRLSEIELIGRGVNPSNNHVDFMIGTSDLNIVAETKKGKVLILRNGNFNL